MSHGKTAGVESDAAPDEDAAMAGILDAKTALRRRNP
jgi:hypothetical protein